MAEFLTLADKWIVKDGRFRPILEYGRTRKDAIDFGT